MLAPLLFSLAPQCAPQFFHSRIAIDEHITSVLFPEPWAVRLMCQYRNRFYSNADHTRRIRKGRDVTKSDACARKTHRTHPVYDEFVTDADEARGVAGRERVPTPFWTRLH